MIQILYTQDHLARGAALASVIPQAQHGLISTDPTTKVGLDTLVFWGHGTFVSLCDLQVGPMVTLIKNWKRLNPMLKTVEILTCNSRHAPTGYDNFAKQMKNGLRAGFRSRTRNIVVKALPVFHGGSLNACSILLAHAPNHTWCYITAPALDLQRPDQYLTEASNYVKEVSKELAYDLAQAGNRVAIDVKDRQFTLNYGRFNTLRAQLGEVK